MFYSPQGIATDGTNLYVADLRNNAIRKIVISTGVVTTVAGGTGVMGSTDGTGSAARFFWPTGVATDGTSLFVTDFGNNARGWVVGVRMSVSMGCSLATITTPRMPSLNQGRQSRILPRVTSPHRRRARGV